MSNYTRLDFLRLKFEEAAKDYARIPSVVHYNALNIVALEYQAEFNKTQVR